MDGVWQVPDFYQERNLQMHDQPWQKWQHPVSHKQPEYNSQLRSQHTALTVPLNTPWNRICWQHRLEGQLTLWWHCWSPPACMQSTGWRQEPPSPPKINWIQCMVTDALDLEIHVNSTTWHWAAVWQPRCSWIDNNRQPNHDNKRLVAFTV